MTPALRIVREPRTRLLTYDPPQAGAPSTIDEGAVSYAYPAGASVKPVNAVVVGTGPR